jgi:hypothetical protein
MSLASANRTALYRVRETVWGTTPANPALQATRYTGESLDENLSFEKSKEIRADRMLDDTVLVDSSPSGAFNFELSYSTFEDLIEAALMGTWGAALAIAGVAGDITTVAAATNNLTSTTAGKFTNVQVGQWIVLAGWTNPLVNIAYLVTGKADNQTLTLSPQPVAAETPAGTAAKVNGKMLRNGVTERSYTLVKEFNDTTVMTRHIFTGMRVKGVSLQMQTKAILTGAFNFIGKGASITEGTTFAGETIDPASTTEILNCVASIRNVTQNNAAFGTKGSISSLGVELDNQHREQKGISVLGNVGVVAGQLMVNYTATQYFESKAQADIFKNTQVFSFAMLLADSLGNQMIWSSPRCKYEKFTFNASQLDSDVMADTQFTALRDPTTNCMVQIDTFPVGP